MNSLSISFTRLVGWVAAAAVAVSFAIPAQAIEFFPTPFRYQWVSQNGTVEGNAHVVRANAGDTIPMSLTVRNRSIDPRALVIYGATDLLDEAAPYRGAHELRLGTANPHDTVPSWLDASSFVSNPDGGTNRLAIYDGAQAHPGDTITFNFNLKVKAGTVDGVYSFYTGIVREFDAWAVQVDANGNVLPSEDIFWKVIVGAGGSEMDGGTTNAEGTMTVARTVTPGNTNDVELGATVEALGFSVEAELSNLSVQRVDVSFEKAGADDDLWDYFESVSLYRGTTLLATRATTQAAFEMDTDTEDTIRLDGFSTTVAKDSTANFTIKVKTTDDDSLDFTGDSFEINVDEDMAGTTLNAIRAVDGAGIQQFGGTTAARTITLEGAPVAALELSLNASNPESGVVALGADTASELDLLLFDMEATGDTVIVDSVEIDVTLQDEGADDDSPGGDLSDHFTNLNLYANNVLVGTEAAEGALPADGDAAAGIDITFDDLDYEIDADETVAWRVEIETRPWDADDLKAWEGYIVTAIIDNATTSVVAEDEDGDAVVETGATSVVGEDMYLYTVVPQLTFVSGTLAEVGDADPSAAQGQLVFKIKALGGDVYFDGDEDNGTTGVVMAITAGDPTTDFTDAYLVTVTGATETAQGNWKILENQTATVTVDISAVAGDEGGANTFWRSFLSNLEWDNHDDAADADDFSIPSTLLEDFRTNAIAWLVNAP